MRNTFFARSPSPLSNSKVRVVGVDVASMEAGAFERNNAAFRRALLASSERRSVKGRGDEAAGTRSIGLPA